MVPESAGAQLHALPARAGDHLRAATDPPRPVLGPAMPHGHSVGHVRGGPGYPYAYADDDGGSDPAAAGHTAVQANTYLGIIYAGGVYDPLLPPGPEQAKQVL